MDSALKQPEKFYSEAEYLALEKTSEVRHEYYQGRIFAMAGASINHNRVVFNLSGLLFNALGGTDCEAFSTDQRVKISESGLYTYPDLLIVCGSLEIAAGTTDTLTNPRVIIEVLSDSTWKYESTDKFELYKGLPSLEQYVLVDPDRVYIQVFRRMESDLWVLSTYRHLDDTLELLGGSLALQLRQIYSRVEVTASGVAHPEAE